MIVSRFVTDELSGGWPAAGKVFLWLPTQIGAAVHAGAAAGWIQGLWTIVVVPLWLWLALGTVTLLFGGAQSFGEAWRRLALPMAVVVAMGHLAKALERFTSWAGFLPYAWAEPTGVQTALRMNARTVAQPAAWLGLPTLSVAGMLLLATGILLALREARLADFENARRRIVSILPAGGFFSSSRLAGAGG